MEGLIFRNFTVCQFQLPENKFPDAAYISA